MIPNNSPWLAELNRTRNAERLTADRTTDVVIVGDGLAGAMTAYFTLTETDKRVIVLEADRVAHGATGHNAGQVVSYFERPFPSLVEEFGLAAVIEGQRSVESAWALLEGIRTDAKLVTPLYRFTGYAGCAMLPQLLAHLETNRLRVAGGLPPESIFVSEESGWAAQVPLEYKEFIAVIPHSDLLSLLETEDREYHACVASDKGCMNSALFTEEIIAHLAGTYPGRFELFEKSRVSRVQLHQGSAAVTVGDHAVEARRVVLCTNGFEQFTIANGSGSDIDTDFHHSVNGRIGYMAGYLEPIDTTPSAISYYPSGNSLVHDPTGDPYFYFTRRPHGADGKNLVCVGGPEKVLPNQADYSRTDPGDEEMRERLDEFMSATYRQYPDSRTEYSFCWHGLMGYTPSGVRRVGEEPCNPVLLYNLGCNGVGILPSIFGGKRIAGLLAGEQFPPSIFDPHDQRTCSV